MAFMKPSQAGLGVRVAAFAFDYIIIVGYLFTLVAVGILTNIFFPVIAHQLFGNPLSGQLTGFLLITLPVSLYFMVCESSPLQATWGKLRKGLRVTRTDGTRLTILRSGSRTLLKFIPWELAHTCIWQISFSQQAPAPWINLGFVLVWILVGANFISLWISPTHQSLYDYLAGTYVVKGNHL
jgi:uncharacterized RDD family membrane protein YckC